MNSKTKRNYGAVASTFLVSAFCIITGTTYPASANTLPAAVFDVLMQVAVDPAFGATANTPVSNSISDNGQIASATTQAGPPGATASVSATQNNLAYAYASAQAHVAYYFQVDGPIDYTGNLFIPLVITASGGVTSGAIFPSRAELTLTTRYLDPTVIGSACSATASSGCPSFDSTSPSFSINYAIGVAPNTLNRLNLDIFATVNPGAGGPTSDSASGYIDPIITFGTFPLGVDPSLYSIEFSEGISNGIASTPLPAALPLFASGLGALGFLGWRRRKKAAALAA